MKKLLLGLLVTAGLFFQEAQAQKFTRPLVLRRGGMVKSEVLGTQVPTGTATIRQTSGYLFLVSGGQPVGLSATFTPYASTPPVASPPPVIVTPGNGSFTEIAEPTLVDPGGSFSWQFNQLPSPFRMPKNRTYVIWSGSLNDIKTAINQYGFTHMDATTLEIQSLNNPGMLGSDAAVKAWVETNIPNVKLYAMIYDGYLRDDQDAKLPGFYDPANNSVTASQFANSLGLFLGNRAKSFGFSSRMDVISFDFEGVPSTSNRLGVIRDGVQLYKSQNPDLAGMAVNMFACEPVGLYENQGERYNTLKNTVGAYESLVPYVYIDRDRFANLQNAKDSTAYWIYQQVKWKRMRDGWLNGQPQPRTVSWLQGMWANFQNVDGNPMWLRPDIAAAQAPLYEILGGGRNGGGLVIWEDGRPHNIVHDYFVAGMWRVGQITAPFEDPAAQYDVPLEYSTDGGSTWLANQYGPYQALGAIDLTKPITDNKPYVLGMVGAGKLVIYATKPTMLSGVQNIKVRYGGATGKIVDVTLRAKKSSFGYTSL